MEAGFPTWVLAAIMFRTLSKGSIHCGRCLPPRKNPLRHPEPPYRAAQGETTASLYKGIRSQVQPVAPIPRFCQMSYLSSPVLLQLNRRVQ